MDELETVPTRLADHHVLCGPPGAWLDGSLLPGFDACREFMFMLVRPVRELRQIVSDLEPRRLRTHPEMRKGATIGVVVEETQRHREQ